MKIGPYTFNNPWILAPMAGVSEMPFRVLSRKMGASAAPTELISAKGLIHNTQRSARYLEHSQLEYPFWVQLFGGEAESMAVGAVCAQEHGADIIDINMGCPVKKVTKKGAGSALLQDPQRAAAIIEAIIKKTGLPVTAKIRLGWDAHTINAIEMVKIMADAGCAAVAVHGRTRAQAYKGVADWQAIAELAAQSPIPIIGNGDIKHAAQARFRMQSSGCSAVMIGRGALGDPWLFEQLTGKRTTGPTPDERWTVIKQHWTEHMKFVGDPLRGVRRFRSHLIWYSHGLRGASVFRQKIGEIDNLADVSQMAQDFFLSAATEDHHEARATAFCDTSKALG